MGRLTVRSPRPPEEPPTKEVAREVFIVEESGDELADLETLPGELQALAERTGGRAFLGVGDVPVPS